MPSVCFYFQVHQPYRLRNYSYFDVGQRHDYFDEAKNAEVLRKVAMKCYLPANQTLLKLIERHQGDFKVSFSITGTAVEQMEQYAPEVLRSFQTLAGTGCVEILGETYHHSLSAVYDEAEFRAQVRLHSKLMREVFGATPRTFRNTELVYCDRIGQLASDLGFGTVLAEGADDVLDWRSPNWVYDVAGAPARLLLKNYRLSDDVAFRFSNRAWDGFPLTAGKFAHWLHQVNGNGTNVNLFMDYETFGEHQWASTGIFDFLAHLPVAVFADAGWDFTTPAAVAERYTSQGPISFPRIVSWADVGRDLTAWNGNRMQQSALAHVYELAADVAAHNNPTATDLWRKLLTSDHFYYMCTKWFADGDVHAYFSPYKSPYDAFINYMNALTDFRESVLGLATTKVCA
jgi:alpha-amylase